MTLALQEIAQACRSLKGDALKQQLYAVFEEQYTTFSRISQRVGKKKYRLGELVQVVTDRGAETQIIVGFDGFSQGNRLTIEVVLCVSLFCRFAWAIEDECLVASEQRGAIGYHSLCQQLRQPTVYADNHACQ